MKPNNLKEKINLNSFIHEGRISYAKDYLDNAKLLLNSQFRFQHVYDMEPSPEVYQLNSWQKSPNGDPEWLYVLKRQEYLQDLLYSYLRTNESEYLFKIKTFIFDWIQNNDTDDSARYQTWRTIDTGIRLLNWSKPLSYLISRNIVSAEEESQINQSVKRQAKYLEDNYIEKYDLSNWGVLITTGILAFSAEHPNIIDDQISNWALDKLIQELKMQVDETGLQWEQSPLYFIEVFRSSLSVVASFKANKKFVPAEITNVLKRMLKASKFLIKPNGNLLQQGDTDSIKIADLVATAEYILAGKFNSNYKYDFLLISLADKAEITLGQKKLDENRYFDSITSGNFFFKDTNSKNYWHIYNGNLGSGHGHASSGHLDLVINDDDIFLDPGRYTYVNSHERRYLKSGFSHNVILVDNTFPTVPLNSWKFSTVVSNQRNEVAHFKTFDSVKCTYVDKKINYIVTRYFIWIKTVAVMVIVDIVEDSGQHLQSNNWILNPVSQVKEITQNQIKISINQNEYYLFHSSKQVEIQRQLLSDRYNQIQQTSKLIISDNFNNSNVSYTVVGKKEIIAGVNHVDSMRNGKVDTSAIHNYGIVISLNGRKPITVNIQHENTIKGNKLYFVNNIPFYGNISVEE